MSYTHVPSVPRRDGKVPNAVAPLGGAGTLCQKLYPDALRTPHARKWVANRQHVGRRVLELGGNHSGFRQGAFGHFLSDEHNQGGLSGRLPPLPLDPCADADDVRVGEAQQ